MFFRGRIWSEVLSVEVIMIKKMCSRDTKKVWTLCIMHYILHIIHNHSIACNIPHSLPERSTLDDFIAYNLQ